ncbi:uncharacterized protein M421DRAFT_424824 [Didymella exigua CBS 183.55]|uniref:Uncharacterized protein n=1 Tax=Didymella exigua CBS 183.55 TaxID=1150837 RepID=A0A6A5R9F1_9PLEO|nr:uncharacterized protein M421DRAFT_424824 [Didymella exigua CBS 183.55]KAF1924372.1 hypothetical protein M421DRAFT_424824 [Didymella exigua CBS 183.55]
MGKLKIGRGWTASMLAVSASNFVMARRQVMIGKGNVPVDYSSGWTALACAQEIGSGLLVRFVLAELLAKRQRTILETARARERGEVLFQTEIGRTWHTRPKAYGSLCDRSSDSEDSPIAVQ